MSESLQQEQIEFAQNVRTTCHRLNNFLTILQCQHGFLGELPSQNIEAEIAGILNILDPLVEEVTNDVQDLSKKCRVILEGSKHELDAGGK